MRKNIVNKITFIDSVMPRFYNKKQKSGENSVIFL